MIAREDLEYIRISEPSREIITPEQYAWAGTLACEMAHKFRVDEADFSIISTQDEQEESRLAVVYTADEGIDLGYPDKMYDDKRSWDAIFLRDQRKPKQPRNPNFTFYADGQLIDSRLTMTFTTYSAMVEQVDDASPDLANDFRRIYTWLTGEKMHSRKRELAPYGVVEGENDDPALWYRPSDYNTQLMRFRPGVLLGTAGTE